MWPDVSKFGDPEDVQFWHHFTQVIVLANKNAISNQKIRVNEIKLETANCMQNEFCLNNDNTMIIVICGDIHLIKIHFEHINRIKFIWCIFNV